MLGAYARHKLKGGEGKKRKWGMDGGRERKIGAWMEDLRGSRFNWRKGGTF